MISLLKPLLIGFGTLAFAKLAKLAFAKRLNIPNVKPFNGQLFTVNKLVDNIFLELAKKYKIGKSPQDGANLLMFHCFSESGLNPLAHNNYENGRYVSHFDKSTSELDSVFAGGLFGLVKEYSKKYIGNISFADWLQSGYIVQLNSMDKWLEDWNATNKIKTPLDIRVLGFAPARLGLPLSATVYENNAEPKKAQPYLHQKYLDVNHDDKITMGELSVIYTNKYNKHVDYAVLHKKPRQIGITQ